MIVSRDTIKSWFRRGLKPLESQFANWIDSFWHKDDEIPIDNIDGLTDIVNDKYDKTTGEALAADLEAHKTDENAHENIVNILSDSIAQKIDVDDIVDNLNSEETEKPLSANMGRQLKLLVNSAGGGSSGGGIYIPQISLSVLTEDISSADQQFTRPKGAIMVRMNFPEDADFLNYNPRIVLLRQSGNNSSIRYIGGIASGNRQKTKRFAYTKQDDSGDNIQFRINSPCAQWFGNHYSFCLATTDSNGDFEDYYTISQYCARYASVKINNSVAVTDDIVGGKVPLPLPIVKDTVEVRLKRGGLSARKFGFVNGDEPVAGSNYASVVVGFQLVSDAGCSNIVYLKVRAVYAKRIDSKGQMKIELIFSWGLLPQK